MDGTGTIAEIRHRIESDGATDDHPVATGAGRTVGETVAVAAGMAVAPAAVVAAVSYPVAAGVVVAAAVTAAVVNRRYGALRSRDTTQRSERSESIARPESRSERT